MAGKTRPQLTSEEIDRAIEHFTDELYRRLEQKGYGSFSSKHEVLGVVTEEYHEVVEATHSAGPKELCGELLDVAVAAVFGWACVDSGKVEW